MQIEIVQSILIADQRQGYKKDRQALISPGSYAAIINHEGKIEVHKGLEIMANFSFSQFREKIENGEIVVTKK